MISTVLSAVLFYLAYPNVFSFYGFSVLAWISLIPLFCALEEKNFVERLFIGLVWGLLAHGLVANWFLSYSVVGFIFFIFLLSLQSVLFTCLYFPWARRAGPQGLFYTASLWVASEWFRGFLMRGFSWDLAHSQVFQNLFLQFADIVGSKGISFAIILVNYSFYLLLRAREQRRFWLRVIVGTWFLLLGYGFLKSHGQQKGGPSARTVDVCLVQPDIDFREKQLLENVPKIVDKNIRLTEQCFAAGTPDFVLWPETAVPEDFRQDDAIRKKLVSLAREKGVSLLLGSVIEEEGHFFNGIVLVAPDGEISVLYKKRYLVPFSEYMPLGRIGARLSKILRIENYDFSPGKDPGFFSFLDAGLMLCSEDTLSALFHEYRRNGAKLLIVFLNDGWFHQPSGLAVHGAQAIMHAVENRIPVIRVSNNGWSGFIDPQGRIRSGNLKFYREGVWREKISDGPNDILSPIFRQIFFVFCWAFVIMAIVRNHASWKKEGSGV